VIAIIAILAAILFPVFSKAREKARQTTCTSNQKQLTTATMMYVQENEETMPDVDFWSVVDGASGKILICPTAGKKIANAYAYNGTVAGKGLGEIKEPTETVCTFDADPSINNIVTAANAATAVDARHTGKAIVGYVDGHVSMTATKIVGIPEVELTFEAPTTDLASLWNTTDSYGWKFFQSGSHTDMATWMGDDTGRQLSNAALAIVSDSSMGGNAIKIDPTGGRKHVAYKFKSGISGDFALAFDLDIVRVPDSYSHKGCIFGIFDTSGARILELHLDGNQGNDCIDFRAATGGSSQQVKIAHKYPAVGKNHIVVERVGSTLKITSTGESNYTIKLPGAKRYDNGTDIINFFNKTNDVGYILFGTEGSSRIVSNIKILR